MPDDQQKHRIVHTRLVEVAGEREADLMMELFTNRELAEHVASLRGELHVEIAGVRGEMDTRFAHVDARLAELDAKIDTRFAQVDTRFAELDAKMDTRFAEMDTRFATLGADLQAGFRSQLIWMVSTMVALAGVIVAAFAAFH